MEWSTENVVRLIKTYQTLPILYDTTRIDYKDKVKKREAWENLARMLECDVREIEKKIHNLRGQFQRERVKLLRTSASSGFVVEPRWFAYKYLKFLLTYSSLRASSSRDVANTSHNVILDNDQELEDNPNLINEDFGISIEREEYQEMHHVRPAVFTPNPLKRKSEEKILENNTHFPVVKSPGNPNKSRDEYSVYGEYVGMRMKRIRDQRSLSVLQHLINTALFEAEMGLYKSEDNLRGLAVCILSNPPNSSCNLRPPQDQYHEHQSHSYDANSAFQPSRSTTSSSTSLEVKTEDTINEHDDL